VRNAEAAGCRDRVAADGFGEAGGGENGELESAGPPDPSVYLSAIVIVCVAESLPQRALLRSDLDALNEEGEEHGTE